MRELVVARMTLLLEFLLPEELFFHFPFFFWLVAPSVLGPHAFTFEHFKIWVPIGFWALLLNIMLFISNIALYLIHATK